MKYRIEITGRGAEVCIGRVNKTFYNMVEEGNIDLDDYVTGDWDADESEVEVTDDVLPFPPGEWNECDDIAHECGAELDFACITVIKDDDIIVDNVDISVLAQQNIAVKCQEKIDTSVILNDDDAYLTAISIEKGLFSSFEFESESFDMSKLVVHTTELDDWELVTGASYDGKELVDLGELSTVGKDFEYWLDLV